MPEIGTSGLMSGERKRSVAAWPKLPRLSSTLPAHAGYLLTVLGGFQDEVATCARLRNGFDAHGRDDCPDRTCPRPDLRSELSRLLAGLPGRHRGLLFRVPLSNDGAVCRVGFGPLRPMRGQSILRWAEDRAQQAAKAVTGVLSV